MVPGGGNYLAYVQDTIAKQYMEKNPGVTVKVEQEPEGGQLTARIAAHDLPDVYVGVFGYQPAKFAKEKLIVDLKDMPGAPELFDRIAPQFVHEDFGGRYYVPWNATTQLMIYNKDLFREAGLDPEKPPVTFDQYLEAAKKISALPKRADGSKVYGDYFWNEALTWGGWYWTMKTQIYYNFNDAKYGLFNKMGTDIVFDKPEANMVEFLKFMKQAQSYAPMSSKDNDFFKRDKGMWLQFGYGWMANLKQAKDKPMEIGKDVGLAPIPVRKEGDTHWSTLDGRSLMIFKSNPEREELAFDFIKFMMDDKVNLESLKALAQLPTLKSLTGDPFFQTPDVKPFVDQLANVIPNETVPELDDVSNILLGEYTRAVLKGEISPEDAVKNAAEAARQKLKG
uniref:Extracellular solute-binding protein n=2 Tax=Cohnella candidum TaxID=2674991 RepID=A0A3G3K5M2_9BACL|nr:extracellular solute-binding protein [Cohnella candidum]